MTPLRRLRQDMALNQTDFARILGVSQAVVSRLEAGVGELTIGAYERLSAECTRRNLPMPSIKVLLGSAGEAAAVNVCRHAEREEGGGAAALVQPAAGSA